jgi:hypothetical protein
MARSKQARPIGRPRQDAAAARGGGGRGEVAGRIPRLLKRKRRMRPGTCVGKIYLPSVRSRCVQCPFCVPVMWTGKCKLHALLRACAHIFMSLCRAH